MSTRDALLIGLAAVLGFLIGFVGDQTQSAQTGLVLGLLLAALMTLVLGMFRRPSAADYYDDPADAARALQLELERARRFERPLSLIRIRPQEAIGGSAAPPGAERAWFERRLRSVDRAWQQGADLLLMLPETTGDEAKSLIARLAEEVPELRGTAARVASFPDDGLTSGSLLAHLESPPARAAAASVRDVGPET